MVTLTAPYVAGFLAFRETPFLLDSLERLQKTRPDLTPQVPPALLQSFVRRLCFPS